MQSRGAMVDGLYRDVWFCERPKSLSPLYQRIIRRLRGRNEGNRLVTSVRSVAKCATEQDKLLCGLR